MQSRRAVSLSPLGLDFSIRRRLQSRGRSPLWLTLRTHNEWSGKVDRLG
jgi:hypothetical protein